MELNEEMFAWVADEGDKRGIVATAMPGIDMMAPLVFIRREVAEMTRNLAVDYGKKRGVSVKLIRFTKSEVLEEHHND